MALLEYPISWVMNAQVRANLETPSLETHQWSCMMTLLHLQLFRHPPKFLLMSCIWYAQARHMRNKKISSWSLVLIDILFYKLTTSIKQPCLLLKFNCFSSSLQSLSCTVHNLVTTNSNSDNIASIVQDTVPYNFFRIKMEMVRCLSSFLFFFFFKSQGGSLTTYRPN